MYSQLSFNLFIKCWPDLTESKPTINRKKFKETIIISTFGTLNVSEISSILNFQLFMSRNYFSVFAYEMG